MKAIGNLYYLIANEKDVDSGKRLIKNLVNVKKETVIFDRTNGHSWYSFIVEDAGKSYAGKLTFYKANSNTELSNGTYFEIKIEYDNNKMEAVSALSNVLCQLAVLKKNEFYLHVLDDSVSQYYREIAYKHTSKYEKKLRELLSVIFVPKSGKDWINDISHLSSTIKPNAKNMIERGLEELDLSQLEEIFFGKVTSVTLEEYEKLFDVENIDNYSLEDLKKLINDNRPRSIWEEYIEDYISISDIETRMITIRKQRNKIAHVKYFSGEDYKTFRKDVAYLTKKVDEAINDIMSENTRINVYQMFKSIDKVVKSISESLSVIIQKNAESVRAFGESIARLNNAGTMSISENIAKTAEGERLE
ncbi:hypothetical protein [Enterococcus diestrammenae]|uniref:hypothetical protein n=1 Tax=Enterococcus diestrammenae TaxID=1155073 RepID=UPI0022E270C4|nr:hypothetical protein [Enterococcus diestrammenae]